MIGQCFFGGFIGVYCICFLFVNDGLFSWNDWCDDG